MGTLREDKLVSGLMFHIRFISQGNPFQAIFRHETQSTDQVTGRVVWSLRGGLKYAQNRLN